MTAAIARNARWAGRLASRVGCPLLMLVYDHDGAALPRPPVRAGKRGRREELVRVPGGHHEAFIGRHDRAVAIELSFLRRHLLEESHDDA